jgi:hypothetical protein
MHFPSVSHPPYSRFEGDTLTSTIVTFKREFTLHTPRQILNLPRNVSRLQDRGPCKVRKLIRTKMAVFWVVAPCSLVEVYKRFRGPCCLHHQGESPCRLKWFKICAVSFSPHRHARILSYNSRRLVPSPDHFIVRREFLTQCYTNFAVEKTPINKLSQHTECSKSLYTTDTELQVYNMQRLITWLFFA